MSFSNDENGDDYIKVLEGNINSLMDSVGMIECDLDILKDAQPPRMWNDDPSTEMDQGTYQETVKLLTTTLKGLEWMVNSYEYGISFLKKKKDGK